MIHLDNFIGFIETHHPVYQGVEKNDSFSVTVKLMEWDRDKNSGSGKVYPYMIDPHFGCFEIDPNEGVIKFIDNYRSGYFDIDPDENVMKFVADAHSEEVAIVLKISKDFNSLTLVDKVSRVAVCELRRL